MAATVLKEAKKSRNRKENENKFHTLLTTDNWNVCGKAEPVIAINTINSFLNLNWVADEENNGIEIRLYIIIISDSGVERVVSTDSI